MELTTLELLKQLNFKPEDFSSFDGQNLNNQAGKGIKQDEFEIGINRDNGAERYTLHGNKDNFIIFIETGKTPREQVLSTAPIQEVLPAFIEYLQSKPGLQSVLNEVTEFSQNIASKQESEEEIAILGKEFLENKKMKTLDVKSIEDKINKIRAFSLKPQNFKLDTPKM